MMKSKMEEFRRKIFTPKLFLTDVFFIIINIPNTFSALKNRDIGRKFMEKIMTVVTAVNGCSYCTWFHAKQAVSSGLSDDEVKNMLKLQFQSDASDYELIGLLYAQHYAETNRNPDEEMTKKLGDFYGKRTANHIILFIRLIYFGNLQGNTFDAFIARLQGKRIHNGNLLFELIFFVLNLPIMGPLIPFVKKYRMENH